MVSNRKKRPAADEIGFTRRRWIKSAAGLAGGAAASTCLSLDGLAAPVPPATGASGIVVASATKTDRRDHRGQGSRVHPQRHQYFQRHSVCRAAPPARCDSCRPRNPKHGRACGARSRSVRRARSPSIARLRAGAAVGTTTRKRSCSTGTTAGRRRIACGSTCGRRESTTTGAGPVLVWIHGGGYSSGSSNELRMYDGESLSRRGDAVVVSLNHRLGVLGYLNLAEYRRASGRSASNVGHAGHRRGAGVGARQHRQLRRRSAQRHDLRAVGRRRQSRHADGHAVGEGSVPARDRFRAARACGSRAPGSIGRSSRRPR